MLVLSTLRAQYHRNGGQYQRQRVATQMHQHDLSHIVFPLEVDQLNDSLDVKDSRGTVFNEKMKRSRFLLHIVWVIEQPWQ